MLVTQGIRLLRACKFGTLMPVVLLTKILWCWYTCCYAAALYI